MIYYNSKHLLDMHHMLLSHLEEGLVVIIYFLKCIEVVLSNAASLTGKPMFSIYTPTEL